MRIVFTSIFRKEFGGGEGRVAHELAHAFASAHDTILICPEDRTAFHRERDGLGVLGVESAGKRDFTIPFFTQNNIARIFDILDLFQPEIIHAHDPALIGLVAQVWARMHNVPFVHTAHVIPDRVLEFGTSDAIKLPLNSLRESVALDFLTDFYRNCDAVVALNPTVAHAIRQFGYQGRVFIIPNGRDLSSYVSHQVADITLPEKTLTFVGWLTERKNQFYLLQMMTHLGPQYHLNLAGESLSPEYERTLRLYAEKHDLANVHFLGKVRYEEVAGLLSGTHVFVSASRMEVQSLVILEALASGTPVVGLSNETVDELIDRSVGRWLPSGATPQEFAAAVEEICQLDPVEYNAMAQAARQRVSSHDWKNVVESTAMSYQLLLKEKGHLSVKERSERMSTLIAYLPGGRVREFLIQRVAPFEKVVAERLKFLPGVDLRERVQPIPNRTLWFTWLTISASVIVFIAMRIAQFFLERPLRDSDRGKVRKKYWNVPFTKR